MRTINVEELIERKHVDLKRVHNEKVRDIRE